MIVLDNFDLTNYNSYRIKSRCSKAIIPENTEDFSKIFQTPEKKIIIGHGNNIILSKKWYDEWFVILNGKYDKIYVNGNEIVAESGASMYQVSKIAVENQLSGLEVFYDIPSSVGGAVVMNAGAGDEAIQNLITKVEYLDSKKLMIKNIAKHEIGYDYRTSLFQTNSDWIVLKACFSLHQSESGSIWQKMKTLKEVRCSKQPREYPNCGSVFKRPAGHYVGKLIDDLGLKGFAIGDAQVSEKHGGFIINKGEATGENIIELIFYIKEKVKLNYNVELELEQKVI